MRGGIGGGGAAAGASSGAAGSDRDVVLKILETLTRLNDKATIRAAAEDLSILIKALDQDNLAALVQSICASGAAWEPKPVAKKEGIRALAQLPLPSCPMAGAVLQHYLPKVLAYLKKNLQDADSQVRDASCEALAAYAQALAAASGGALEGHAGNPVVRVIFESLAEQKREAQVGASQALLQVAPWLAPLDRDLVKLILRLLKSPAFQGGAQLLAAVASTDPGAAAATGLLKYGPSAFLPYLSHLIGQPASRSGGGSGSSASFSGGGGGGRAPAGSGMLGCLASKDHAVRRAAADAVRAAVVLLGPALEPEGCWALGDPGSLTARCMSALDECRFDKVKEARDAARDAATLLQQLHRFVAEYGPDTDEWPSWATNNLPYSGTLSPARSARGAGSPGRPATAPSGGGSFRQQLATSPVAARFRQAAAAADVVVSPGGSTQRLQLDGGAGSGHASDDHEEEPAASEAADDAAEAAADCGGAQQQAAEAADTPQAAEAVSQPAAEAAAAPPQQQRSGLVASSSARRQWSGAGSSSSSAGGSRGGGGAPSSRPGSSHGGAGRPGSLAPSAAASRRGSSNSSSTSDPADAAVALAPRAAAAPRSRPASKPAVRSGAAVVGSGLWAGPTEQEWRQVQLRLSQSQQLVQQLQQQVAEQQQVHLSAVQQLHSTHLAAVEALQARIDALEASVQQQQSHASAGQAPAASRVLDHTHGRGDASTAITAECPVVVGEAGADNSTPGGTEQQQQKGPSRRDSGVARLYRSEDWGRDGATTPGQRDAAGGAGRGFGAARTPLSSSTGSGLKGYCGEGAATPGDLDAAYADALRGDRGEVHLMRLLQKTGPAVWQQLAPTTHRQLLIVFTQHVRDGVMLHRVLPALWRLADEAGGGPDVPWDLQQQLLEALACCPAAEEPAARDRVALLMSTLKAAWGLPPSSTAEA